MSHGEGQVIQSTSESTFEIVNGSEPGNSAEAAVANDNSTAAQEEKKKIFERVEREMEAFRKGECTRFHASS